MRCFLHVRFVTPPYMLCTVSFGSRDYRFISGLTYTALALPSIRWATCLAVPTRTTLRLNAQGVIRQHLPITTCACHSIQASEGLGTQDGGIHSIACGGALRLSAQSVIRQHLPITRSACHSIQASEGVGMTHAKKPVSRQVITCSNTTITTMTLDGNRWIKVTVLANTCMLSPSNYTSQTGQRRSRHFTPEPNTSLQTPPSRMGMYPTIYYRCCTTSDLKTSATDWNTPNRRAQPTCPSPPNLSYSQPCTMSTQPILRIITSHSIPDTQPTSFSSLDCNTLLQQPYKNFQCTATTNLC